MFTLVFDGLWVRAKRAWFPHAEAEPAMRHGPKQTTQDRVDRRTIDFAHTDIQCKRLCPPYGAGCAAAPAQ